MRLITVITGNRLETTNPIDLALIIPARNEENTLPRLLESIAKQNVQPAEIIVVDDNSTDGTATIARAAGATVISAGELPEGWRGKPWACQQGAKYSTANHLLFLDADTWFEPSGLGNIWQSFRDHGGVVSVLPHHLVPTAVEQLSAFFNLIMAASVGGVGLFNRRPAGLFGQMLLIDRKTYDAVDGHERVRQHVLENLHLAAHLRQTGATLHCFGGRGTLSMRMYPGGLRDIVEGWTKGFASGAGATSAWAMFLTILWLTGAVMAVLFLIRAHSPISLVVYLLYAAHLFWMLRRLGSYWLITALMYPIPLLFFFGLFANSLMRVRRTVTWKGRTIHAN